MEQATVRQYVERYFQAFASHIMESHPDYLSVTLPVEVDKDIGNRPFYWTWVEKMNLPYHPLTLTFFFNNQQVPQGMRGESLHFGSARLGQIFSSARRHGQFVCLYEQTSFSPALTPLRNKRSVPLIPWLGLNVKISFICDKKRDVLCYFGINLHQPRLVHDFYPFLKRLSLSPGIPDYHFTLDRRLSPGDAVIMMKQETARMIALQDGSWAKQALDRLSEEIEILEAYYAELQEKKSQPDEPDEENLKELADESEAVHQVETAMPAQLSSAAEEQATKALAEPACPVRILDFLRMNGIQQTPKEAIVQADWQSSSPSEEKERRIAELRWQYEPRIELTFINGGIFYLQNQPPFHS